MPGRSRYSAAFQKKREEEKPADVIITEVSDDEDGEFKIKKHDKKDYVDAISLNDEDGVVEKK